MKIISKKRSRRFKLFARLLLYFFLLIVVGIFIGVKALERAWPEQKLRPFLEKEFSHFLKRKLTIEKVEWGFRPSPVLIGRHVQLWENESHEMAFSPQVNMFVSLKSFLKRRIEFEEIEFINAQGTFRLKADRTADLFEMIKEIKSDLRLKLENPGGKPLPYYFHRFSIVNGRLFIVDEKLTPRPLKTTFLVNSSGDIKGEPKKRFFPFVFNAQIESQKKNPTFPEKIMVGRLRSFLFQRSGFLKVKGVLGQKSEIEVVSEDFPLSAFSEHFPSLRSWTGSVSIRGETKQKAGEWNWQARGESINLAPAENLPWPALRLAYDVNSNNESFLLAEITDSVMDAAINISVPKPKEKQIQIALASTQLSVESLLEYWQTARLLWPSEQDDSLNISTATVPLKGEGWRVDLSARAQRIEFRNENFDDLELDARRSSGGDIFIEALNVKGFEGDLVAKSRFEVRGSTIFYLGLIPPNFSVEWNLSHVDLLRTSRVVGLPPLISGIGSTEGRLSGNLSYVNGPETQGSIKLNLSSGVVYGVPGLVKTFTRLNIQSLIKKESERNKEGLPFDTAAASIVIRNGIAQLDPPALFTNDTLQVAFLGNVDLAKQTVKGHVVIHFVTFISEIIGAIPGVSTILLGNEKSIVPLWIDVEGPLQDPEINVRQSKWFTDPIFNTIGRVFSLPAKLIKSLRQPDLEPKAQPGLLE